MSSETAETPTVFQSVTDAVTDMPTPVSHTDILTSGSTVLSQMPMPGLEDLETQTCSVQSRKIASVPGSSAQKTSSGGNRKSREGKCHGTEKSQELSKKLVKALTEKILKRMNQKNEQPSEKTELDTAVSTLTSVNNSAANVLPEAIDVSSTTVVIEDTPETILNSLPEDLPIIEASNIDASTVTMTSFSPMTSLPQSYMQASPHTNPCLQTPSNTIHPPSVVVDTSNCPQTSVRQLHNMESVQAHPTNSLPKQPQYLKANSVPNGHSACYTVANTHQNTGDGPSSGPSVYYYPDGSTPGTGYMFPAAPPRPQSPRGSERDIMLERYIQQQNTYFTEQGGYQFQGQCKETYNLKSPDSGYGEPCVSPRDMNRNQVVSNCLFAFF